VLAELVHDSDATDELIGRLAAYDADGSRRARASQPGGLIVHATAGAAISLDGQVLGTGRIDRSVAAGTHVVGVAAPGAAVIREPIAIERDATLELELSPPAGSAVPDGYVYVAPGSFLYGSAADEETRRTFFSTVPLHARRTGGFIVARTEVTFTDWLAYVEAQPVEQRPKLVPNLPIKFGGGLRLERAADAWKLTLLPVERVYTAAWGEPIRYDGRKRHAAQDWSKLPVLGISATDAAAYAAWLARTGRLPGARLCSELEWERAARGADGRTTPTGRVLEGDDANISAMTYDLDLMGPDEVGSHAASASPYGLLDVAGNAFEWTAGERAGTYVARGGSYYHDRKTADLSNRNQSSGVLRDPTAGTRVCATR
jgi:formylglycine-generating enzyme required for sulfatase activity